MTESTPAEPSMTPGPGDTPPSEQRGSNKADTTHPAGGTTAAASATSSSTAEAGTEPKATAESAASEGTAGQGAASEGTASKSAADESTAGEGKADESTAGEEAAGVVGGQAVAGKRRWLILVGAAVVVVLLALVAVALFVLDREERGEAGECVRETAVVACTEPHEARIVEVVQEAGGCTPPATHAMKEADRRYLCLVEDPS